MILFAFFVFTTNDLSCCFFLLSVLRRKMAKKGMFMMSWSAKQEYKQQVEINTIPITMCRHLKLSRAFIGFF